MHVVRPDRPVAGAERLTVEVAGSRILGKEPSISVAGKVHMAIVLAVLSLIARHPKGMSRSRSRTALVAEPSAAGSDGPVSRAQLRLRIVFDNDIRIGPGKADLLDAIGRTGSISAAGRELGMSYRRCWLLVDEVNRLFRRPVVQASAGGAHGGGARLTDFGRALVSAYRRVEERARAAIREEFAPFESDLIDGNDHAG